MHIAQHAHDHRAPEHAHRAPHAPARVHWDDEPPPWTDSPPSPSPEPRTDSSPPPEDDDDPAHAAADQAPSRGVGEGPEDRRADVVHPSRLLRHRLLQPARRAILHERRM